MNGRCVDRRDDNRRDREECGWTRALKRRHPDTVTSRLFLSELRYGNFQRRFGRFILLIASWNFADTFTRRSWYLPQDFCIKLATPILGSRCPLSTPTLCQWSLSKGAGELVEYRHFKLWRVGTRRTTRHRFPMSKYISGSNLWTCTWRVTWKWFHGPDFVTFFEQVQVKHFC